MTQFLPMLYPGFQISWETGAANTPEETSLEDQIAYQVTTVLNSHFFRHPLRLLFLKFLSADYIYFFNIIT